MRFLGSIFSALVGLAIAVWGILCVLGCLQVVHDDFGPISVYIGFLLLPVTVAAVPFYAVVAHQNWQLLLWVYGLGIFPPVLFGAWTEFQQRRPRVRDAAGRHSRWGRKPSGRVRRVSRWLGVAAALVLFALVPPWYVGLPLAVFGFWLSNRLCAILGYQLDEALCCDDRLHRVLAAVTLLLGAPIGTAGFCLVPNWNDFEVNGHPSLVAVAGSVIIGVVSFAMTAGLVAVVGVTFQALVLRLMGRNSHRARERRG
jgi:hypothetical protein